MANEPFVPDLPTAHWSAIAGCVVPALDAADGRTPYSRRDLQVVVARHVHWCWQTAGMDLTSEAVFDRRTIERFIAVGAPGTWSPATRGNARSMLFRVSEVLLGPAATTRRSVPLAASDPARPYSSEDIQRLGAWASNQRTATRVRDALCLLCLGLGAGLAAEDQLPLHVRDIADTGDHIEILVPGRRARTVVLLAGWESTLRRVLAGRHAHEFAFRPQRVEGADHKNAITNFVKNGTPPPVPFNAQRMRSTWLVHHLEHRTPVRVLLEAAGIESMSGLDRYVKFVRVTDTEAARSFLRGGNTP